MGSDLQEAINRFLIEDFNYILLAEEHALSSYAGGLLSVNEFHIIETVLLAARENRNTMGEISRKLGVTMGTLTIAVKTLEKKGFLRRRRSTEDRRIVRLEPTPAGAQANAYHQAFHRDMVETVAKTLSPEQLLILTEALEILAGYFAHTRSSLELPDGPGACRPAERIQQTKKAAGKENPAGKEVQHG